MATEIQFNIRHTPTPMPTKPKLTRVPGPELALKALELNLEYAAAHIKSDLGHDQGTQVNKVERVWGMKGEPYCAMGQFWCLAKALLELCHIQLTAQNITYMVGQCKGFIDAEYLYFDPACVNIITHAKERGQWREFSTHGPPNCSPGDYILFNFSGQHHIGMVQRFNGSVIQTIEWNTIPRTSDRESDPGGESGVFIKHRPPDAGDIMGFVSWHTK